MGNRMMEVSGYLLKTGIETATRRRTGLTSMFTDSVMVFPSEMGSKEKPEEISRKLDAIEQDLVALQCAQDRYNATVMVDNMGQKMTLSQAIKTVGGISRMEKLWEAAGTPKEDRYGSYASAERSTEGKEYKTYVVIPQDSMKRSEEYSKRRSALSRAIAEANGTKISMEVPAHLFD